MVAIAERDRVGCRCRAFGFGIGASARKRRARRTYELVGEGAMQWAPDYRRVVGNWDSPVETD